MSNGISVPSEAQDMTHIASQEDGPRLALSEKDFCKAVGVSRMTAFRLREAGRISYCKVGNRILYLPRHVMEFLNANERRAER